MTLAEIIKVCNGPININFYGEVYSTTGHEFSHLYNDDRSYYEEEKKELNRILAQYGKCEVADVYGWDDGLTITIKENQKND